MVYYVLFGIVFCFCLFISVSMHFKLRKFYDVKTKLSGFETAKKFLSDTSKKDMYIVTTSDSVNNYYDISNNAIKLSSLTFNGEDLVNTALSILVSSDACMGNKFTDLRNKLFKYFNYVIKLCYLVIILCFLIKQEQFCYALIIIYIFLFICSVIYFIYVSNNINSIKDKCKKMGLSSSMDEMFDILKYREFSLYIDTLFRR